MTKFPLFCSLLLFLCLSAGASPAPSSEAEQSRPRDGDLKCFFGALHAHTVLSGDFLPQLVVPDAIFQNYIQSLDHDNITNGPLTAFRHAAGNGVDFFGVTDHIKSKRDGKGREAMLPGGYKVILDAAKRINQSREYAGKFLAVPGMEWNIIRKGNHVNIFFADEEIPTGIGGEQQTDQIPDNDFKALRDLFIKSQRRNNPKVFVQMNHPDALGFFQSYGRDRFAGVGDEIGPDGDEISDLQHEKNVTRGNRQFAKEFKKYFTTIEHIIGHDSVMGSNGKKVPGFNSDAEKNEHKDGDDLGASYRRYLSLGFHLGPVAGHDSHRINWGKHTAARTGIWLEKLSEEKFAEAVLARRVFATEDQDTAVLFKSGDKWMGSVIRVPQKGRTIEFEVRVDVMADRETGVIRNAGPYKIELIGAAQLEQSPKAVKFIDESGKKNARIVVPPSQTVKLKVEGVIPGAYYYAHIEEQGHHEADAWTAPIWFAK